MEGMSHTTMAGLPPALFWMTLGFALLLTLWSLWRGPRWLNGSAVPWRLDLLAWRPLEALVARRPFQFVLQLPLVLLLFLILATGLYGTPVAERNFATVATWTLWWTLLILDIVLLGRMWCLVCPWEALASWLRRIAFWRRRQEEPLALELRWPRWLRNVYPATLLFVGLTWLELGFGVTRSPRATALLGLLMVLLAVLPALVFERRSFCRYGCLIGRICGLYSMVAPVEVRARNRELCRTCTTKDCLRGNQDGYPCPTGQCLASMSANTYCTVCTECVKSCPRDNVALNLRPWASDLHQITTPRRDEAILALVLISLTSFHGLTMTPTWATALAWLRGVTGFSYLLAFSFGMALILVLPAAIYLVSSAATTRLIPDRRAAARSAALLSQVASRYAYPLVALALMYHLAHNVGHFLAEAAGIVPVLSDPFGSGRDLFRTAGFAPGPLASAATVWGLQISLVLLGLFWALRTTERAHRGLADNRSPRGLPLRARAVTASFLLLLTAYNLWLLAQPMDLRSAL
jgi:polyferredoxin